MPRNDSQAAQARARRSSWRKRKKGKGTPEHGRRKKTT